MKISKFDKDMEVQYELINLHNIIPLVTQADQHSRHKVPKLHRLKICDEKNLQRLP